MHVHQPRHRPHTGGQLFGCRLGRREVVANEAEFKRGDVVIIQLFVLHIRVREGVSHRVRVGIEDLFRGLHRMGVDDQLGVVFPRHAWRVRRLEAWRGAADKGRDRLDAFVLLQLAPHRVGHLRCALKGRTRGQVDLDNELVAFGHGHHAHLQLRGNDDGQDDGERAQPNR